MSILVGPETRLVVQGITGREGDFHSRQMREYGTNIVAGMTPGKAPRPPSAEVLPHSAAGGRVLWSTQPAPLLVLARFGQRNSCFAN